MSFVSRLTAASEAVGSPRATSFGSSCSGRAATTRISSTCARSWTHFGQLRWEIACGVAQWTCAEKGPLHHRQVGIPELLIAAAAELAELTLLHYDRDFELITEVTGQPVRALAPLGSL